MENQNEYIHKLVASGLSVLPITEGEKRPHQILGPKHDLLTRLATQEEVDSWITGGVKSWGVAGGAVSGNLVTLDFDEKHYPGLYELWYAKLSDEQRKMVDTCHKNSTRNKGTHLHYRTQTSQPTTKLARRVEFNQKLNKEEIVTTAETKAHNGYALIPPSAGYITMQGSLLDLPLVSDEIHEELVDLLRVFNEVQDEPPTEYEWKPTDVVTGNRPGDRFNQQASWSEILEPHGWVEESKNYWRRPGKEKGQGISATTNHEDRPIIYVFSSSASPFEQNRGYSKFHAFTLLNHGGDFKEAAREAALMYPKEENVTKSSETIGSEWSPTNRPRLWSIGDILGHDFGMEEWLIDSLISKQGMMALSGNPGDYKTWVSIHFALCVSRNLPVFGKFKTVQGGVLIIDEEDHLRLLKKRLELLGAKDTDNIHYFSQSGIKVDVEAVRDMILEIVREKNIKLVILDSLVRVHQQEENDSGGMSKVFSSLQKIIKAGASILFTHHHRKQQKGQSTVSRGQSMRGSSDILAAVDSHTTIEKKNDTENRLVLRQTKLRQGELLPPFEVTITTSEFGPSGFEYAGDYDEKKKKAEEVAEVIPSLLVEDMLSRSDIHKALKEEYGKTVIDMGIKLAEETEAIERVPKEDLPKEDRRKLYYQLPTSQDYIEEEKQEGDLAIKNAESEPRSDDTTTSEEDGF